MTQNISPRFRIKLSTGEVFEGDIDFVFDAPEWIKEQNMLPLSDVVSIGNTGAKVETRTPTENKLISKYHVVWMEEVKKG